MADIKRSTPLAHDLDAIDNKTNSNISQYEIVEYNMIPSNLYNQTSLINIKNT